MHSYVSDLDDVTPRADSERVSWVRNMCRCAVFTIIAIVGVCVDISSAQEPEPRQFDILAGSLASALNRFADETSLQLIYDTNLAEGRTTAGISGNYTVEQALKMLLAGTGLDYRFANDKTVTLLPATTPVVVPAPAGESQSPLTNGGKTGTKAAQKPVKVQEIVVRDVKQRDDDATSYVTEETNTATRTDTPSIQVPQSVGVVTRKVIEDQRNIRLESALSGNVSSVLFAGSGTLNQTNDRAFCRGFECEFWKNHLRNFSNEQTLTFRDIANIERIEVLKGPPSVLYGRSTPSGIVNVITKQPMTTPYASMTAVFGSFGLYRPMIDVSGPLTKDKDLSFRINGAYENSQSFRDVVQGQRYFIAPVIGWTPGHNTTLAFEGEFIRDRRTFDPGLPAIGQGIAPLPNSRFLGEAFNTTQIQEYRAGFVWKQRFNDNWRLESLFRAEQATDDALFAFTTGVAADNVTATRRLQAFQTSVGSYYWRNDLIGKVALDSSKHTFLTGVEIGRQTYSNQIGQAPFTSINIYNPVYGIGGVPATLPITTLVHSFANAVGGYVQDQIDLFDKLHVLVGARGDYFYQHTNSFGVNTKAENYGFSPRIGVTYQPLESVSVYANVTRSFQPVFGVSSSAAINQFIPRTATGYEAGIKTDIVPGRLMGTLAVYRILINNALVVDPTNPTLSLQIGRQRSQGIEYDLTAKLLPNWNVIMTYAYTDARDVEDTTFPVGNRLPNIPRNMGRIWSTYDFQSGPLDGFGVGAGVLAIGKRAGDLQNDFYLPGFVRMDMAFYYRKPQVFTHTNLTLQLNIQNLLDSQYFLNGGGGRGFAANPGSPLAFMGSIKLEFD